MLNDEFSLGVVSETVVLEDGAVVELRQSADADLSRLHSKPVIGLATFWLTELWFYNSPLDTR